MRQISLDIEACGEIVVSVGACEFDPATGDSLREFYVCPSIEEQMRLGLKMDAGAFLWWLKQDNAARQAVTKAAQTPCHEAIHTLREFIVPGESRVWAYPTSFDLPVIARLCSAMGVPAPWKWTETMDGRTLWKLATDRDPMLQRIEANEGPDHDALADAKQQARWFAAYLKALEV